MPFRSCASRLRAARPQHGVQPSCRLVGTASGSVERRQPDVGDGRPHFGVATAARAFSASASPLSWRDVIVSQR